MSIYERIFPDARTWSTLIGAPYITVSSKGIANGKSTVPNDGADFGPDTPGTQTSGIQEAITYCVYNKRTLLIRNGVYIITAPFVDVPGSSSGFQAQIIVPYVYENQQLTIIGEAYYVVSPIGGNPQTDAPVIYSQPSSYPSATTSPYPFVWAHDQSGTMDVVYNGFVIRQKGTQDQVNGMLMIGVNAFDCNIRIDIDQPLDTGAPATPPSTDLETPPVATAFQTANSGSQPGWNRLTASVFGYNQGLLLESQTEVLHYDAEYVTYPIMRVGSLHPVIIYYINNNNCPHLFTFNGGSNAVLWVLAADIQDNFNTTYWYGTVDHIDYVSPPSDVEMFIRYMRNPQPNVPLNAPLIENTTNRPVSTYIRSQSIQPLTTATIPANPPVSGTAYQNTNPYAIEIDLPVYATTSGTAGSVAYGVSSGSIVTEMTPEYVSGDTSSGAVDIVRQEVPTGWYYEYTYSGVTAGTAIVHAR